MLYRFGDTTFGGVLMSADREDFKPGGTHLGATLSLWHADEAIVSTGATFIVWYGGVVGRGVVVSTP